MSPRPLGFIGRLLHLCLPAAEREEILGDLLEEFVERARVRGAFRAHLWYARQGVRLAISAGPLRRGVSLGESGVGERLLGDLGADIRLALRTMRRAPGLTTITFVSLVASVGIATVVFSIVTSVLMKPLPISTVDRVVRLSTSPEKWQGGSPRLATIGGVPPPPSLNGTLVGAWLSEPGSLDAIATYSAYPHTVVIGEERLRVGVADVGAAFFQVLPVVPTSGRTLQPADAAADAARVAVVSERVLAQRAIDAGPIVGRTITIEDVPHQVVGVVPSDFAFPNNTVDAWVVDRTRWPAPGERRQMNRNPLVLGLLHPAATAGAVATEGQRLADRIIADGMSLSFDPTATPRVAVTPITDELLKPVRPALLLLVFGTVGIVIAANVNLAGFLLSRHSARRRDLAMRQALGASSWRLVRPVVVEQLMVAAVAAVGALGLAALFIRVLPVVAPHDLPRLSAVAISLSSLAFAIVAAFVTALVIGLLPARRLSSGALRAHLSEGGDAAAGASAGTERLRRWLVVSQVGAATLLLVGAAFVGRNLLAMMRVDLGYQPSQVLTFQIGVSEPVAYGTRGRLTRLYDELLSELRAQPGVVSAGTSTALPLHGDTIRGSYVVPGLTPPRTGDAPWPTAHAEHVDPSYLQTIGATLTSGRFFTADDRKGAMEVAIVNEAFARTFMPGVDALGQIVPSGVHRYTVVGVIRPIQRAASINADDPALYLSAGQTSEQVAFGPTGAMGVAVRTTGPPEALAPIVRRVVNRLEPDAPVYNVMPLESRVARTFAQPRFFAVALALFSALALATALTGIYGVLSAVVARRRIELGVRRALGATGRNIAWLVMGEAARLAGIGVVVGSVAAGTFAALARSTVYGASPLDAGAYAGAAVVVAMMVALGAWVPMRSATRIDPARVLRSD